MQQFNAAYISDHQHDLSSQQPINGRLGLFLSFPQKSILH
jgi:hypothetical protein